MPELTLDLPETPVVVPKGPPDLRPVMLLTFDVPFDPTAVEFAVETAAETGAEPLYLRRCPRAHRQPRRGRGAHFRHL